MKTFKKIMLVFCIIIAVLFIYFFMLYETGTPLGYLRASYIANQYVKEHCAGENYQIEKINYSYDWLFSSSETYKVSLRVPESKDKYFYISIRNGELGFSSYTDSNDWLDNTKSRLFKEYKQAIEQAFGDKYYVEVEFNLDGNSLVADKEYDIMLLAEDAGDVVIKLTDFDSEELAEAICDIEQIIFNEKISYKNLSIQSEYMPEFNINFDTKPYLKSKADLLDYNYVLKGLNLIESLENYYKELVRDALGEQYDYTLTLGLDTFDGVFKNRYGDELNIETAEVSSEAMRSGKLELRFAEMSAEELANSLVDVRRRLVESYIPVNEIVFYDGDRTGMSLVYGSPLSFDADSDYEKFLYCIKSRRERD